MKTIMYKILFIACFIPSLAIANNGFKGKYTKEKKIKKEYNVNADALLKINNSYGNLHVTSWTENKVVIEVHIQTNGNNEEKVKKKLDEIDVVFDASKSMVSAKTVFEKKNWGWSKNNNVSMKINYTVKVPVTNSVDLDNNYGAIHLNKLQGKANINCDYGKLDIGSLMADNNTLSFDYTSNSIIEYVKSASINADYSGFTIEKAENIKLNADYTGSKINSVKNLEYNCDYGSLKVDALNNIKGQGDYLTTRLGTVSGNVSINADYGSLKIQQLTAAAGNVTIQSEYTGIKIGFSPDYSFSFNIQLSYGGFNGENDFEYINRYEKYNNKKYEGYYKSKNNNTVTIKSSYGGVTLYKN